VSGFTYNALRLPTQDSRADGVTETYSYDQMGRMLTYDAGSLYTLSLGYNTAGDVTSATDSINGTWTYAYYGTMMHKLSWAGCSANCSNGWANFAFAFDQYGNRWQQVPSGNGGGPLYTFTSSNQISTSDGVSYNASGDMIADGNGNTYSYDGFHRVYNISGNTVAAFIYDAFGDRVNENPGQSGSNLDLVFDQGKILHRNNSTSGNGWGMEIHAGKHIGFYNDHFYFDYQDQVGSTRMMTQYTNTGSTVVETCPDLPFGDWASCSGTMPGKDWFRFADFLVDADQEAVSQTRRLSTVQGRWSSPDPAGLAAMDLTNPQTLNLYSYVMNNPLSNIDPTGLVTINPNWYMGFGGGGGCTMDGMDTTCEMVNATIAGGGANQTFTNTSTGTQVTQDSFGTWYKIAWDGTAEALDSDPTAEPGSDYRSDAQLPAGLPLGTPQTFWKAFTQGLKQAQKRLRRKGCGNFYGGQGAATLSATQYSFEPLPLNVGAATVSAFNVFLNSDPNGPYMNPPSSFLGVSGANNIRGLIFLHELGHQLANTTLFIPDAGSDVNQLQTGLVIANCF
jgi:RHS repeat-associated protein